MLANIPLRRLITFLFLLPASPSIAQKTFSEGVITYDISVETGQSNPGMADMFHGAKAVLYLRGNLSRSELNSALGSTVTIFDHRAGNGVVLRDFGSQKLLIRMNQANWDDKNGKYEGIRFKPTGEKKTIAGYPCEKADAVLKDGSTFSVFYTRQLVPENSFYEPQFSELPGMAMEYESRQGDLMIRYSASKVSFDPVPMQRFEIPKSGYRELNYEESKKRNGN
jgi:GLPGLI family protein